MNDNITSAQNPKVKLALKLRKAAARKKEDLILIEGYKEISLAAAAGLVPEMLFYCPEFSAPGNKPERIMSRDTIVLSAALFRKLSYRKNADGFIALARPVYRRLDEIKLSANPLIMVLETVEKPGNLGAVLRSADAAGADAVIVCEEQTDIYNPNVIRASLGAVFLNSPIVCSTPAAIGWLKEKNISIFAAALSARLSYAAADLTGPSAIAVGAEHAGLSPAWLQAATEQIRIPMRGRIDSLNASVSAAVILFEVLRQRSR
ncbi:MAG: RNA methyltransferase [Planctomycetes bacterium]|jgi:TrmH family RNA methyltransferase|nr:RNA methyltransferase [Planctomycetota bacterium]